MKDKSDQNTDVTANFINTKPIDKTLFIREYGGNNEKLCSIIDTYNANIKNINRLSILKSQLANLTNANDSENILEAAENFNKNVSENLAKAELEQKEFLQKNEAFLAVCQNLEPKISKNNANIKKLIAMQPSLREKSFASEGWHFSKAASTTSVYGIPIILLPIALPFTIIGLIPPILGVLAAIGLTFSALIAVSLIAGLIINLLAARKNHATAKKEYNQNLSFLSLEESTRDLLQKEIDNLLIDPKEIVSASYRSSLFSKPKITKNPDGSYKEGVEHYVDTDAQTDDFNINTATATV
ncbi:MAG: hypothetical protein A3F18_00080 [Legionellales bacterium RIFCSPHIGHO2_12_FULL_37_14]|nr:MAG: hypothetical protein A3F18_00080 [Legionellales bacterium RIFCSPHIGHO2_12_FULL_37_14]